MSSTNYFWLLYIGLINYLEHVEIGGTIIKYENKEKHQIYVETLTGKNHE